MISSKKIVDNANARITAGLTEEEVRQLSSIDQSIINSKLTVATTGALPTAADNKGRLVYVSGEDSYYFSDGTEWLTDFSTTLVETGVVYAWGSGGKLGTDTVINQSSPVTVVGGITNWSAISSQNSHSLGLTSNGILYAWGSNGSFGRLGDNIGQAHGQSSPVTVVGGITNWSSIETGEDSSFAITDTGIAYGWGRNGNGGIGDGTTIDRSSPVTVVGGITNWSQISSGDRHALGIAGGVAYAWGYGGTGRLGDDAIINRSSPVTVVGGITNWSAISAGYTHSHGITDTGILYAWGWTNYGRTGTDESNFSLRRSSPVTVVGGITNWSQVSAGNEHSLGLTSSGILYSWGRNIQGRLGIGTTVYAAKSSPVTVVGGITNWSSISTGRENSFATTDSGIAYAWGRNNYGTLGDGTLTDRGSPVTILGDITNWVSVSGGFGFATGLAITQEGFNEP